MTVTDRTTATNAEFRARFAAFDAAVTPPEIVEARLREALELIDRDGCETFTGTARCLDPNSGRTRGAKYGADKWCDPCIARDVLAAVAAYRATQDGGAEAAVRRVEALVAEYERTPPGTVTLDRDVALDLRATLAPQAGDGAR
jgi:hypothetical protein